MTDAERDTLLRTLDTGMVRLSTMIEEGLLRRVQGLEEAQNQVLALIAALQKWRTDLEKERLEERSLKNLRLVRLDDGLLRQHLRLCTLFDNAIITDSIDGLHFHGLFDDSTIFLLFLGRRLLGLLLVLVVTSSDGRGEANGSCQHCNNQFHVGVSFQKVREIVRTL